MTRSKTITVALLTGGALLLSACAGEGGNQVDGGSGADRPGAGPPPPDPEQRNLVEPGYDGRFVVSATVLESPEHGPQLCTVVADSYPPQCGGPDIVGWDWDTVEVETASGTTWGEYQLVGTWDGTRFTLTEPATPAAPPTGPPVDFTPPCPEPEGGWQSAEPGTTSDHALQDAFARAQQIPAYAGGWVYRLEDPGPTDDSVAPDQDPARLVLVLRFTEDLAEHEAAIREVWGGALCVSGAERTEADLQRIQLEVQRELTQVQTVAADAVTNAVTVNVLVATTEQQEDLNQRYGEGAVLLHGTLQPID